MALTIKKVLPPVVDSQANLEASNKVILDGQIVKVAGEAGFKLGTGDKTYSELLPFKGTKGDKGDPFSVIRSYASVQEMEDDFATTTVPLGLCVIIDTGDVEDPDNAKLYSKGETEWVFVIDMSGAAGITGQGAYEAAVADGFVGTKAEWVESLHATVEYGAITIAEL